MIKYFNEVGIMKNTRKLVLIALFLAISYLGAFIKIPGPAQSIALDSFSGYLGGLVLGGVYGGFIGSLGHIFTSMVSGFPLSLPVHMIISAMMFFAILAYSILTKKFNIVVGTVVGTIINGVLMPVMLMVLPGMDKGFLIALIPILTIASFVNIIIANFVYAGIKSIIPEWINE